MPELLGILADDSEGSWRRRAEKAFEWKGLLNDARGLGFPTALYLAAAGVGTIRIVDAYVVSMSNFQRQFAHHTIDIGGYRLGGVTTLCGDFHDRGKRNDWPHQPGHHLLAL